ncbi:MAG: proprotein convertase P-domain-containing protein, partial [Bacteroidota bacterium]|nr:proprotein convertase P-domain-containing protein [Bacteroidota bacterium]
MKNFFLRNCITVYATLFLVFFTAKQSSAQTPYSSKAVKFVESIPVREMKAEKVNKVEKKAKPDIDEEINEKNRKIIKRIIPNVKSTPDAAITSTISRQNIPSPNVINVPGVNFEGLASIDNFALFGSVVAPPDDNGEVGLNHYVQTVNLCFRVFSKAGVALTAPTKFSTLFAALGAPIGTRDDGDPIVLYDQLADRWLISQFITLANPNNHQVIAISKTGDPTGQYYLYDFMMPNNKFNDYPHFGVWSDAYYMSDNQFNQAGTAFLGAGAFAFDRNKMLAGDPTASYIYFDQFAACPSCVGQLPTDLDGFVAPPPGMGNLFMEFRATEFGDPVDGLRIFEFKPNFVTPASSTYLQVGAADLPLAAFDAKFPGGRSVIEQPGTANGLDAIADRLMHRLAYRNLGTPGAPTNSWVLNFTVNVGGVPPTNAATYQAGIRWAELRRVGAAGAMSVNQQGTLSTNPGNPAGGTNIWMGSISQNFRGDIVLGYSTSGSTNPADFPSIKYSGRLAADPAGLMSQGEAVGVLGTGFQNGSNRWGDYSAMSVDPVNDCSFWYTQEYRLAANNGSPFNWNTRVVGDINFSSGVTSAPKGTISGVITDCVSGLPIPNVSIVITGGFFRSTNITGNYAATVAPGTYTATVSVPTPGYNTVTSGSLVVTNGGNATFDACLTGIPNPAADVTAITAESCAPANGGIDPNEILTVSFTIKNNATTPSTNLVATLLATGGVTSPSGPQTYGVIAGGGGTVARPFSFTAANLACGAPIVATLQLQDGAINLGTITYNFTIGAAVTPTVATFSYTGTAVAIPDNVPAGVNIPLLVSGAGTKITDLNFRFDPLAGCDATALNTNAAVDHTFLVDLIFKLTSPGGTTITFMNKRGGSGNNICNLLFDDDGGFPAASTIPSTGGVSGNFAPETPFSVFDGQNANGTWTLNVSDNVNTDVGSLRRFSLILTSFTPVCCTAVTPPTVTINQAAAQPDPTSVSPINFTVVFSEPVTGFATGDITLSGTAGATTAVVSGAGPTYNVAVSGMTTSGTVIATIAAGVATGTINVTGNAASTSTDNTVTYNAVSCGNILSYTGPAVPIPDNVPAGVNIPLNVSGVGAITDLDFRFDPGAGTCDATVGNNNAAVDHTFIGDLIFKLTSPLGTTVTIVNRRGGTRENICNTLLDDDGGFASLSTVTSASGQFLSGNFAPDNPLSAFDGQNPNGVWTLNVSDNAGIDVGSFRRFSLIFNDGVCCVTPTVSAVANQTVCNGAPVAAVTFNGTPAAATFDWTNNTPSIGLAANGTGNIASFNAVNTSTTPVVATITVTPKLAGCPDGAPINFTITVNPTPTAVATPASQTICSATAITTIVLTGNVSGTTYN